MFYDEAPPQLQVKHVPLQTPLSQNHFTELPSYVCVIFEDRSAEATLLCPDSGLQH